MNTSRFVPDSMARPTAIFSRAGNQSQKLLHDVDVLSAAAFTTAAMPGSLSPFVLHSYVLDGFGLGSTYFLSNLLFMDMSLYWFLKLLKQQADKII
jgi:Mg/Co/Ni transporter MgtE